MLFNYINFLGLENPKLNYFALISIDSTFMFTKQSYESIFESILVNKYCKEFHIIDNPNLMFSLAQKTNYE